MGRFLARASLSHCRHSLREFGDAIAARSACSNVNMSRISLSRNAIELVRAGPGSSRDSARRERGLR